MQIVKAAFHNNLTFHSTHPLPTGSKVSSQNFQSASFIILKGCDEQEIQTARMEVTF